MSPFLVWSSAALLYVAFRLWYDGFRRRPLTMAEVDDYMKRVEQSTIESASDRAELRRFLEEDDGKEFVMLNLVKLHAEPVAHPTSGVRMPARKLIQDYMADFLPSLIRRGGVPLLQARKVGPYIDSWDVPPDPDWTIVGYMRYRSRRDLMKLSIDPRFQDGHGYKHAAIAMTSSFPTQPRTIGFMGPRVWVALVLALSAALVQIASA